MHYGISKLLGSDSHLSYRGGRSFGTGDFGKISAPPTRRDEISAPPQSTRRNFSARYLPFISKNCGKFESVPKAILQLVNTNNIVVGCIFFLGGISWGGGGFAWAPPPKPAATLGTNWFIKKNSPIFPDLRPRFSRHNLSKTGKSCQN